MSFINPDDYGINFSVKKEEASSKILWNSDKYIHTENVDGLLIEVQKLKLSCNGSCEQKSVDSGSFTLINTCSMPITITGLHLTNPKDFSLFDHEKYQDLEVYETGSVEELPIIIQPRKKASINTFFHPGEEKLRYGKAGSLTSRDGDQFGSLVHMYPGFKISNCSTKSECEADIILTGELVCADEEHDLEWMENKNSFNEEFNESSLDVYETPTFENEFFLRRKPTFSYTNPQEDNTPENYFSGISGALEGYANYFDQNSWFDTYFDFGITGTLRGVFLAVSGLKENGQDNSRENLYNIGFDHIVEVNDFISYRTRLSTEDHEEVNYEGEDYIVLKVKNQPLESIELMTNQSLFLRETNPPGSIEMFLCDEGDFQNEQILES